MWTPKKWRTLDLNPLLHRLALALTKKGIACDAIRFGSLGEKISGLAEVTYLHAVSQILIVLRLLTLLVSVVYSSYMSHLQ